MPLPISHGFLGATLVAAIHPKINKFYAFPLLIGGFLANAADFDFLFVFAAQDPSWHRAFSHSILFSGLVFFGLAAYLGKERMRESLAYGLAYFSHVWLDYLTTRSGGGLELFWFFSAKKLKLGLFGLSEEPLKMPFFELLQALGIEALIFGSLFAAVYRLKGRFGTDRIA
ncbi:MAG: metal-dependent hydrolase [Pyrinomonadaceae bacterium]